MLPVIAIVGRPNVGKSTLFNAITRSRDALVADRPGVTRDRHYGMAHAGDQAFVVVDTGGLSTDADPVIRLTSDQARQAISEADALLFVVDAREGLNAEDQRIASELRGVGRPVVLVANKVDGLDPDTALAEFHGLGLTPVVAVSAAHRRGLQGMLRHALDALPAERLAQASSGQDDGPPGVRVAIVGRPNVGKSTLVNRLTGSDRVVTHDTPGTTRDSVEVPFQRDGRDFVLIDTAGLRRRGRVDDAVEKFSAVKTLQAIAACDVVVLMLDASDCVSEQDAHLLGLVLDAGRAVVIAANKWDGLETDQRRHVREEMDRRLRFVDFATIVTISARHGSGLGELLQAVERAHASATAKLPTPDLTRALQAAVERTPPPAVRGRRIKLRYAHQGGSSPPRVVIHGNQLDDMPANYRRYLERFFRTAFDLQGTPVVLDLRTGKNPFEGRRNVLTPRQERKRKRLMQRVKRR